MGKYFTLAEFGTYGLVMGYIAVAIPLLGFRLDYVVSRTIVGMEPLPLAKELRDQGVFYLINYSVLIVVSLIGWAFFPNSFKSDVVFFTIILSILENFATVTSTNLISLRRPVLATFLFTLRSAAWVFPLMVVAYFCPELRNYEVVFYFWTGGVAASLVVTAYIWRDLPWKKALQSRINWELLRSSLRICPAIWLGSVGAALAFNVDRFVVEYFIGRDFVGIFTFYMSFTRALWSLIESGVFVFALPQLIALHKEGKTEEFWQIVKSTFWQSTLFVGFVSVLLGFGLPYLGKLMGKEVFAEHDRLLWLMLLALFLKSPTQILYLILYARHQDRPIWVGNILLLAVAALFNVVFVNLYGFIGVGYGGIVAVMFIAFWRGYYAVKYDPLAKPEKLSSLATKISI